ncbi:MAG: hypothetical protein JNL83_28280 [Myxococcales bacterium]|nr:hypothetical protein [Myxococcales bacterium]
MKFPWLALLAIAGAGCAKGDGGRAQIDAAPGTADAAIDASPIDSAPLPDTPPPPIDAPMADAAMADAAMADAAMADAAMIDAPMIDAPMVDAAMPDACVPVVSEILTNPALDLTPMGTGWQQTVIDPAAPLITDEDGIAEHSAPYKAWLGGIVAPNLGQSVTDVLWQDVAVPAGTTQLTLAYYVAVATGESASDTNVYDTASVAVTQTNGTVIAAVASYSNRTPLATWTQVTFNVPQNLSGQTVRLRLTSSNDFSLATSFWFDSFNLTATHCP